MKGEKRERIIRILLDDPDGSLTAYKIHKKADCSEQWVGSFLRKLRSVDLVDGTRVTDIIGLYKHWLMIRILPKYADYHLQKDPLEIIGKISLPYAL
ncbi:MAG: hypothetical protein U9R75_07085, partial [Candidatus Thermoplasmatota archaeon]|nr:hypothetical protein [Candidatus Thermoplasmatota archaeon]